MLRFEKQYGFFWTKRFVPGMNGVLVFVLVIVDVAILVVVVLALDIAVVVAVVVVVVNIIADDDSWLLCLLRITVGIRIPTIITETRTISDITHRVLCILFPQHLIKIYYIFLLSKTSHCVPI